MTKQSTTTPTVKTEFVEVLTSLELLSPCSPSNEEFSTVLTDSSLLDLQESHVPNPETLDLIQIYDETFPSLNLYFNFVNA